MKKIIRFFDASKAYKHHEKLSRLSYFNIKAWVDSGNFIKIDDKLFGKDFSMKDFNKFFIVSHEEQKYFRLSILKQIKFRSSDEQIKITFGSGKKISFDITQKELKALSKILTEG